MDLFDMKIQKLSASEREAWRKGFFDCLDMFAIWKDGTQVIGCMETDIKEIQRKVDAKLEEKA